MDVRSREEKGLAGRRREKYKGSEYPISNQPPPRLRRVCKEYPMTKD